MVTELGSKADLERDHIKVDGRLIHKPKRLVYIALNKPDSVVTTVSDPQRRRTVMDLLTGVKERVYPVGRLDYHSEGLLLLTNDGEFANALTSAATHIPKTYVVKVNGTLSTAAGAAVSRRRAARRPKDRPGRASNLCGAAKTPGTRCGSTRAGTNRSA